MRASARASGDDALDDLGDLSLLPEQLVALRGAPITGAPALMAALLEDAIACIAKRAHTRDAQLRAEAIRAERWIRSHDASSAFSFESICTALDLHAGKLRQEILRQATIADASPATRQRRRHEVVRRERRLEVPAAPRRRRPRQRARQASNQGKMPSTQIT